MYETFDITQNDMYDARAVIPCENCGGVTRIGLKYTNFYGDSGGYTEPRYLCPKCGIEEIEHEISALEYMKQKLKEMIGQ